MNGGVCLLWTAEQFEGIGFYRNQSTFSAAKYFLSWTMGEGAKRKARLELNNIDSVDQVYYRRGYFIKELGGIAG